MLSNGRSVGAFRTCALLFLALSVFWFGLHARLEAFTTGTSNLTASKMSTERHSAEVLKALDEQDNSADGVALLFVGLLLWRAYIEATRLPLGEVAKIELADPRRLDFGSNYSLHGPPATTL